MTFYGGVLVIWAIVAADPSINPEGADVSAHATWAPAFDRVATEVGSEMAELLFVYNPQAIIEGKQAFLPPRPKKRKWGFLGF